MFVIVLAQLHRERSSSRIKSTPSVDVITVVHVPSQFDTGATVLYLSRNSLFDPDTLWGKLYRIRRRFRPVVQGQTKDQADSLLTIAERLR